MTRQRLEALAHLDILDTPPEQEFDDIVFLASEICGTPVALVSLLEENRQWFKARIGLESCDTPLEQSICVHALSSPELLVIPDLSLDPRTSGNSLVTEDPQIRFYAGAPLTLSSGVIVGTLCVIDMQPRREGLSQVQQKALLALARQVVVLLEMRRTVHRKDDLFRKQKRISQVLRGFAHSSITAQEAGSIGTFEIDTVSGDMRVTAEFCRIFGVPYRDRYPASLFESMVLAEDRHKASDPVSRIQGSFSRNAEYRIQTPENGIRWISRQATFAQNGDEAPLKMYGMVRDITEEKREAQRARALLDLGDRLRDLDSVDDIALQAAELMAVALGATRAGFGIVDPIAETVMMQNDWRAPGIQTLAGLHHFRDYGTFIDDLKRNEPVIIHNVRTDPRTRFNAEALEAIGIAVLVNVPVFDRGQFDLVVFVHDNRPRDWSQGEVDFIRNFADRVQTAVRRVKAAAAQNVLNHELSHRLKNSLAMVHAIARQTLKSVRPREPVDVFEMRLHALGDAHEILLRKNWSGASVREIVEDSISRLGFAERFGMSGPSVEFGSKPTLALTLLLHELATNAVKYGAFSREGGRVEISWSVDEEQQFHFRWQEEGGPEIGEPDSKGFGSRLIQMGLVGTGGVTMRYASHGLAVDMAAPLSQLQQAD